MELAVVFIVHLIFFISTNGSEIPRSIYADPPFEQEKLLNRERELHEITYTYDELMSLKHNLIRIPYTFNSRAYLEEMAVPIHRTRAVINNYIVNHQARRHSRKVRIASDMMHELGILRDLIQRRMAELRHAEEELPQQHQLEPNLRTSQQQESEHPSSSTEPPEIIHVIMPGSDRPTHFGIRRFIPGTQQQNEESSSNAERGSG